jgi:hypothetical protein
VRIGGYLSETTILSQVVTLPTVPEGYELELRFWYHTEAHHDACFFDPPDDGAVGVVAEIREDQPEGENARFNRVPICESNDVPSWTLVQVPITQFNGQQVTIVIYLQTVGLMAGEMYIDDLEFASYCNDDVCESPEQAIGRTVFNWRE